MLVHHGLTRKKQPSAAWAAALRTLHRRGWSDARVAARLGCSRETARRRREALGLPPNPWRGLESRQRYRRQMDNADAVNLIDLRWRPARVAKLLRG
jgi:AraC-like DNA-binding protein